MPRWLNWLDLVLLPVALPVFLIADLPIAGYLVGGGAWLAQRFVQGLIAARVNASDDPRSIAGLMAASMILRGWLVALSVFLVGLADNDAGLAAAVLVIALFTVYFAMRLATRPFEQEAGR
jgi:hypothetical protein